MSKTTIRVVTRPEEFESLAPIWDRLLEDCRDESSMYLSLEWLATWWRYFGEGKRLNLLLFEREGKVTGIVPLARNLYRIGPFKLDALESITWTSCNYMGLVLPEHRDEVTAAFLGYLKQNLHGLSPILRLSLIPEDSQFLSAIKKNMARQAKSLVLQERVRALAPYIELPSSWEEYFASLGERRRKVLKGALRRLERKGSVVELRQCEAGSLDEVLSRFFDLHQERWRVVGLRGSFAGPRDREFHREVARKFLKKNWLHLSSLTIDGDVASVLFACIYNHKFYAITEARNIRYARYSVGHLHEMEVIKDAISRRLKEFDFLQGDEPYKFYWTKSARRYMQVIIIKRGFMPALRLRILRLFLRLCDVRQYRPMEIYRLYRIIRRERTEHKKMGLARKLSKLKRS
jgi:CelD/BcsL family acetyltransferase involved in cellulose biosynthesis